VHTQPILRGLTIGPGEAIGAVAVRRQVAEVVYGGLVHRPALRSAGRPALARSALTRVRTWPAWSWEVDFPRPASVPITDVIPRLLRTHVRVSGRFLLPEKRAVHAPLPWWRCSP
jgi:hypothetical protein